MLKQESGTRTPQRVARKLGKDRTIFLWTECKYLIPRQEASVIWGASPTVRMILLPQQHLED